MRGQGRGYEIKKRRGESHDTKPSPLTWKQFIDLYIVTNPKIEPVGDSLNEPPF